MQSHRTRAQWWLQRLASGKGTTKQLGQSLAKWMSGLHRSVWDVPLKGNGTLLLILQIIQGVDLTLNVLLTIRKKSLQYS